MKFVGKLEDFITKEEFVQSRELGLYGRVQKAIDTGVIRYCSPYVPYKTGTLMRSANTATDIGSGMVIYNTPYARYQYYGNVMGPNIPITEGGAVVGFYSKPNQIKQLTGQKLNYNTEHSPLSGSFWFDRAMADHKDDLLKEVRAVAGAG